MPHAVKLDTKPSIFGLRRDVLVFMIMPFVIAAGLALAQQHSQIESISPLAFFLLYVLFDHFHVYLGLGTALNFREQTKGRSLFYLGFPILCFALYSLAFHFSESIFYSVFAYASIFHFGRQQIGWMRASGRRGCSFTKADSLINDMTTYASTFGFVLYRVASAPGARWFVDGDLGFLPGFPAQALLASIVVINTLYLGVQIHDFLRHRYVNVTKNVIWLSTLIVWSTAFYFLKTYNVVSLALIVVQHAAPFVLLSILYSRKRLQERWSSRAGADFVKVAAALSVLAVSAAAVEFGFSEGFFSSETLSQGGFLEPLLATFSTYHYAVDSFFWRSSFNPGCMRFLEPVKEMDSKVDEVLRQVS